MLTKCDHKHLGSNLYVALVNCLCMGLASKLHWTLVKEFWCCSAKKAKGGTVVLDVQKISLRMAAHFLRRKIERKENEMRSAVAATNLKYK